MQKTRINKIHSHLRNQHRETLPLTRKTSPLRQGTLIPRERKAAARMQAEASLPETKDVYKVSAWKWGIDDGSPRWRQLFFVWIFLPFLDLAFKLGIPTPKEVSVESDEYGNTKRIFRWYEDEGIFEHEDQADLGCLGEHWGYTLLPYGRLMPPNSAQYGGTVFPRKQRGSRKWARPRFPFVIKDRSEEERHQLALQESLAELNRVLDR
jgi:hypothetical protein